MEYWDVYDNRRNLTGDIVKRGKPLNASQYHLVVHVCIFNENHEMLIQFRQPLKQEHPSLWDLSAGGAAISGENSSQAAEREVYEETGLNIPLDGEIPYLSVNFDFGFDDYYIIERSIDIQMLKPQQAEVLDFQWADKKKIIQMLGKGMFVPYHKSFLEFIFAIHQFGRGTLLE